jgi:hypothetical protein
MGIDPFYIEIHQAKEVMRLLKEVINERYWCEQHHRELTEKCTELFNRIDQILKHLETGYHRTMEEGNNGL